MAPEWDMEPRYWLRWFELWKVSPWTDGAQLVLRPRQNVPEKYLPMLREAKPMLIQYLIERRDELRASLEELSPVLAPYEAVGMVDHPEYQTILTRWGEVFHDYGLFCLMAPERIAVPA